MSVNTVNNDGSLLRVAGGTLYADLPIGSWVKNDSDTIPSGFLKAGDTISQTLYPELYAMYGNTVPYKADTSELGDYENVTFPTSLQVTAQYDGVIITTAYDGGYLTFNINDNKVYIRTQSSGINAGTATVPIRKGDVISVEGAGGNYTINVRYYKKSLIVKAKQVAVPFDVAEYIRNQNVLSDIEGLPVFGSPMPYDGIIYFTTANDVNAPRLELYMNGTLVAQAGYNASSNTVVQCDSIPFMKGDIFTITGEEGLLSGYVRFYKLRDYTGR